MEQDSAPAFLKSILPVFVRLILKQQKSVRLRQYDKLLDHIEKGDFGPLLMEAEIAKQKLNLRRTNLKLQEAGAYNLELGGELVAKDRLTSLLVSYVMMSHILLRPITLPPSDGLSEFLSSVVHEDIGSLTKCLSKFQSQDIRVYRSWHSFLVPSECRIEKVVVLAGTAGVLKHLIDYLFESNLPEALWKARNAFIRFIASFLEQDVSGEFDFHIQTESEKIAMHIQICEGYA
uniref:AlNc14C95G5822 protein n=1 Tax=Albugo laibachii Nc14 TaxID=890382 RepID=F0WGU5_9STRA|nr:AlNc14C95G5822 [Albugo laibachii Nc14]|eukprot:CCA20460.1 AlNc14C95G5822 [Albugo laibachii Nc14]